MLKDEAERIGVHECASIFTRQGFIFREQTIKDYGIDAIIETKNDNYLSRRLIAVQIKSGESYFKERKEECVVYRGDIKHYYCWLNHSLPVIIVLYSPTTGECIWSALISKRRVDAKAGGK